MATKIVNLLLNSSGEYGELTLLIKPKRVKPDQATEVERPVAFPITVKKNQKVTPEMRKFIFASVNLKPNVIIAAILQKYGVELSKGTIYKTWKAGARE